MSHMSYSFSGGLFLLTKIDLDPWLTPCVATVKKNPPIAPVRSPTPSIPFDNLFENHNTVMGKPLIYHENG